MLEKFNIRIGVFDIDVVACPLEFNGKVGPGDVHCLGLGQSAGV